MTTAAISPRAHRRDRHHVEAWNGGYRRYDLLKELGVALLVVTLLTVLLAALFSSPDDRPVTIASWARADPGDFLATSITELDRTSEVATYGPPYTSTPGAAQDIGPVCLQCVPGVTIPVDTATAFVLGPLAQQAPNDPALAGALARYRAATAAERTGWTDAYAKAIPHATFRDGAVMLAPGDYGPVALMMSTLLTAARSGAVDGALLSTKQLYQTDYTLPILFLSGGSYFEDQASGKHLLGEQWGMMNETGNWPGQPWLWLYTFWYQVPPFSTSGNADAVIWAIMMVLTLALILVPLIPGVRSIPYRLGAYKLIWREYYRATPPVE